MDKICIIGKDSYIGTHIRLRFENGGDYVVDEIEAKDGQWKKADFSRYDTVIQVAGIVHRPDVTDWDLYKSVNVDLPVEIAKTAKASGVSQFVFLSTMGVFGVDKKMSPVVIDEKTLPNPISMYGKSKYIAEEQLKELEDEAFKVTIVRPPNVYGKDCKGGYITGFASVVRKVPFIPKAYTGIKQSVIYIDNLTEVIFQLVQKRMSGTYMPQDEKAVSAVELMSYIAEGLGLKRNESVLGGIPAYLLSWTSIVRKAYGGIEYATELSDIEGIDYRVISTREGIRRTLG